MRSRQVVGGHMPLRAPASGPPPHGSIARGGRRFINRQPRSKVLTLGCDPDWAVVGVTGTHTDAADGLKRRVRDRDPVGSESQGLPLCLIARQRGQRRRPQRGMVIGPRIRRSGQSVLDSSGLPRVEPIPPRRPTESRPIRLHLPPSVFTHRRAGTSTDGTPRSPATGTGRSQIRHPRGPGGRLAERRPECRIGGGLP